MDPYLFSTVQFNGVDKENFTLLHLQFCGLNDFTVMKQKRGICGTCYAAFIFPNLVSAVVKYERAFHCAPEDGRFIAYEIYICRISCDNSQPHRLDKRVTCNLPLLATLVVHAMAHGVRHRPITAEVFEFSPRLFHMVRSGTVIDFPPRTSIVPCQ